MASISVELLIDQVKAIINQLQEQQDDKHVIKVNHLYEKLMQEQLSIALCGHFSAGKSTLINTLCGAKLLPSSPIPTSANVVTLAYGETAQAEVEIANQGEVRTAIVPIDKLNDYCVDGETYTSVKIKYPSEFLKQGIQLLDTPGIDSTDDAHRLSTESALHLADVVFYVMDYNHVQSEINFSFAKQLKEWGKPLYFIVNQIDKHRDEELSFEKYKQSVWDAFHAWHLEPAGIIYLSLKNPSHKAHQWESLLQLNKELITIKSQLKVESVKASLKQIMMDHIEFNEDKHEAELVLAAKAYGGKEKIELELASIQQLKEQINELSTEKANIIPQFRNELDAILKNANITPASLRDKLEAFLESRKPGFKQGFLFTKGKTEAEQQARLQSAYTHLVELIQSNIVWHVQQALRQYVKPFELDVTKVDEYLAELNHCLPEAEWLVKQISQGAVFGNQYTMTYSQAISEAIKRIFKDKTISLLEQMVEHDCADRFTNNIAHLNNSLTAQQAQVNEAKQYFIIKNSLNEYKQNIQNNLRPFTIPEALKLPAVQAFNETETIMQSFVEQKSMINISQSMHEHEATVSGIEQVNVLKQKYVDVSQRLLHASEVLSEVDQLHSLSERLIKKATRLNKMNFTISLFGAFSAGKSSLANALIGDAVLPVSPNPTTAAINSILPPDAEHAHNTATIYMKSEQMMIDDLIYSLKLLGLYQHKEQVDKKKLFDIIDKIKPENVANSGRAHYSFVKAARKGWTTEGKHLGRAIEVNREQYVAYVAEESLSCFVQEIKFYYDCSLTASGIVLVDTPGADSVNARHTGVAFNYIKNTDAIIFVTYYNHAFSHADRQFLDQLGRVKDQFELDKMFFVVNAADLASNEEELQGVLNHVKTNLESHQIKDARLFPISSIMALESKQSKSKEQLNFSGMQAFEQQFYSFIQHELGEIVVQSAINEHEAVKHELDQLVQNAKRNLATRDEHISQLKHMTGQFSQFIEQRKAIPIPEALMQEVSELTYYIVQRIQLRFTDFYNYAINPASIKEEGRQMQHVLYTAWLELERSLALELKQELLATTLRINKFANRTIAEQTTLVQKWLEQNQLTSGWTYQQIQLQQPDEHQSWTLPSISSKWLWQYFKSAKHFFEQQGKQQLRSELEPLIFDSIRAWMLEVCEQWKVFYSSQYTEAYQLTLSEIEQHTNLYIDQAISLLNDEAYLNKLELISTRLK